MYIFDLSSLLTELPDYYAFKNLSCLENYAWQNLYYVENYYTLEIFVNKQSFLLLLCFPYLSQCYFTWPILRSIIWTSLGNSEVMIDHHFTSAGICSNDRSSLYVSGYL